MTFGAIEHFAMSGEDLWTFLYALQKKKALYIAKIN